MGQYDLIVSRRDGDSYGYMADWANDGPISISSSPPDLPTSTSADLTSAGGNFSARDAAPPYPIVVENWQDGSGQPSHDKATASPDAYKDSFWMDVSDDGHFEIGPKTIYLPDTTTENVIATAGGAVYAGFHPDGTDPQLHLRVLARYNAIAGSSAGDYLSDTSDTSLVVTDSTALAEISAGALDAAHDIAAGDFLYCPNHHELVKVSNVASTTLTVSRGQGGTTAIAHTAGETWQAFKWKPVVFAAGEPDEHLTAVCPSGGYVYASFHNPGTDNGSVWRGTGLTTSNWASYASTNNVVALTHCAGYLCGAQDNEDTGGTLYTRAGYWDSSATWVPASMAGGTIASPTTMVAAEMTGGAGVISTVALTTVGNYVYWVTTAAAGQTYVYRYQPAVVGSFEMVWEGSPGFTATCALGHLGNLYVCGYIDTLATDPDNSSQGRYEGALYLIAGASDATSLTRWKDTSDDVRVRGLSASGPYLHVLTTTDVRIWSIEHGGWWHYADVANGSTSGSTGSIDWTSNGFYYDEADSLEPDEAGSCTGIVTTMVKDTVSRAGAVITPNSAIGTFSTPWLYCECNAEKYVKWTVETVPSADYFTADFHLAELGGAGMSACFAAASKEVRFYSQALYSGSAKTGERFGLRSSSAGTSWTSTVWSGTYGKSGSYWPDREIRITLSSSGADLYIDDDHVLSVPFANLLTVTGADATKTWFAVGRPGDPFSSAHDCVGYIREFMMTPDGAYPPSYSSTPTTTSMKGIACLDGRTFVPAPGHGVTVIDPKLQHHYGYLETSDSCLHMGSVDKYFSSLDVVHSALESGQSVQVTPYIDDLPQSGTTNSTAGDTITTSDISTSGRKTRAKITLRDTGNSSGSRPWADRLRVYGLTTKFFPANAHPVHTYQLNCRPGVQTRSGSPIPYDADASLRHLFACADSGEVVDVSTLYGDFEARIEEVQLSQGPADQGRYDALLGTAKVKIRSLE